MEQGRRDQCRRDEDRGVAARQGILSHLRQTVLV